METLDHRRECGVKLILSRLRIKIDLGKIVYVRLRIDREGRKMALDLVQKVRVGLFGKEGGFVIGLERRFDFIGLVGEVNYQRALFLRHESAVQSGQRL